MERTSTLPTLSQIQAQVERFKRQPRPGQLITFRALAKHAGRLCIKLPTGYGKTYTALGAYSILKAVGCVNRLLVIFPTDAQLQQFCDSTPRQFRDFAIEGPRLVDDVRFFGAQSIQKHQQDKCQMFAITVQSLIGSRGMDNISTLLQKGRWMVVVDEYHHYGIALPFGNAVNSLAHEFLLCMSATPHRPKDDGAFGVPAIEVTYRQAVEENAVKELQGHAYHYKIDAIDETGEVISMTTQEIISKAGGDTPEKIDRLTKKMRFSPKYISPLITNPIDRMLRDRLKTGKKLQAVIGCMSVAHAQLVFEQLRSTFPSLNVEWVGTGENGRPSHENSSAIKAFSPNDGTDPTVDVLVHVGMAGEGLDTVNVSEVVHLNAAGVNNGNNQENGRAARYLSGVLGHINFDGCSGYAESGYTGRAIMDAMDCMPPSDDGDCEDESLERNSDEWYELPDEPEIRIYSLECIEIDSGDETVQLMIDIAIRDPKVPFDKDDFEDADSEATQYMIQAVRHMRAKEAEQLDEKSTVIQWTDSVSSALSVLSGNVVRLMKTKGVRVERTLIGDIKKRINGRKKHECGPVDKDIDILKRHYRWIKDLESAIKSSGAIPTWLA